MYPVRVQFEKFLLLLFFVLNSESSARKMNIEILTYGFSDANEHGPIWWFKVPMDHAVAELRNLYQETMNITHTYILYHGPGGCVGILAEIDVMLSKWYYKHREAADLHAIIAPGKRSGWRDVILHGLAGVVHDRYGATLT